MGFWPVALLVKAEFSSKSSFFYYYYSKIALRWGGGASLPSSEEDRESGYKERATVKGYTNFCGSKMTNSLLRVRKRLPRENAIVLVLGDMEHLDARMPSPHRQV